ncbi:MAG: LysR family transcriptional regulator [Paraburkholderia sp.]|uniref:LysR family transcriptional regulator n=1 Tax=Paraburkholderia sp. TaxID=1926495 RepID=UPI003C35013B
MDTFSSMKIFIEVAESGSFTAAAEHLKRTTGYMSRSVSRLEAHLHTRLFNRTTRRVVLTEAGERYLEKCYAIMASVAEAEAQASDAVVRPVGTLRVHAPPSMGQNYVIPAIAAYQKRYPDVTVDLTLSQTAPDLLEDGYDVALRTAPDSLPDSTYISQRLGTLHSVLCASPKYLEIHGVPKTVEDLSDHTCMQVSIPVFPSDRWLLQGPDGEREFRLPTRRFKVNSTDAMAVALQQGMGIAALPTLTVRSLLSSGALVRVLPEYQLQRLNIFALYASRQYLDAKIKTWIDFLRTWIAETLSAEEAEARHAVQGITRERPDGDLANPTYVRDPDVFAGQQPGKPCRIPPPARF